MPYHLHPEYPPEGLPREVLVARYGDHFAQVQALVAESGLGYDPHPTIVPNTRRALEVSEWARAQGGDAHDRLHERIMDAYWAEARDITGWDVLRECLTDVGLDPDAAQTAVESGAYAEAVDGPTNWAQQHGIAAIPAFVFNNRVLVSGAMPHEFLRQAAEQAVEAERQATAEEG
jgi:predicted DsbA family dithiol-disulfide isomerase